MPGMRRVADLTDPDAVAGRPDWVSVNAMRDGDAYQVAVTGSYSGVINRFPVRREDGTLGMRTVLSPSTKHLPLVETMVVKAPESLDALVHALALALHEAFPYGCPEMRVCLADDLGTPPLF